MAGKTANLLIKILLDAKDASKGLDETATGLDKFQSGVNKLTGPALGVVGAIGLIGKQSVDSASQLQQSMGGIEAVFGDAAGAAEGFADKSAETVGLAKSEYGNLATVIGAQLKNAGTPIDELAGKTDGLITIGADLAATFGGSTSDAVGALSSALKGEMDPIEQYGITLNAAAIEAKRTEQGTQDLTGAADAAAKQQAILALITEQSTDAQGQFGREIDSVAGQQQVANAKFEDAKATLGTALLPAVTSVTKAFSQMADFVSENSTVFLVLGGIIGGFAVAILAASAALKIYKVVTETVAAATKIWTAVQKALNITMSLNVFAIIVIAILALIAAIVYIATKTTWFQDIWNAVWGGIQDAADAVWQWLIAAATATLDWLASAWQSIVAVVTTVWNAVVDAVKAALQFVRNIIEAYIAIYVAIWNGIVAAITAVWDWVKNLIRAALEVVKGIIKGYIEIYVGIFEGIKSGVGAVWDWLKDKATTVLDAILHPIDAIKRAFDKVVDAIRSVIDWLGKLKLPDAVKNIADTIGSILPFTASVSTSGTSTPVSTRGLSVAPALSSSASAGSGVTIVIQGALDPSAVARQIRLILRDDDRRRNGVTVR